MPSRTKNLSGLGPNLNRFLFLGVFVTYFRYFSVPIVPWRGGARGSVGLAINGHKFKSYSG